MLTIAVGHPLASDFAVDAGLVSFIVPDGVLSASNYIVVCTYHFSSMPYAQHLTELYHSGRFDQRLGQRFSSVHHQ